MDQQPLPRLTQDRIAAGHQVAPVGYSTRVSEYRNEDREFLSYRSDDHGSSIAVALAKAFPGTPGDASANATWEGRDTERLLLTTSEKDYLDATNYDSSGNIESHEGFDDASSTTLMLTQVYEDAGDLEVTLVDDEPAWTGETTETETISGDDEAAHLGFQLGVFQGNLNGINGLTDMGIQGFNTSKNLGCMVSTCNLFPT